MTKEQWQEVREVTADLRENLRIWKAIGIPQNSDQKEESRYRQFLIEFDLEHLKHLLEG